LPTAATDLPPARSRSLRPPAHPLKEWQATSPARHQRACTAAPTRLHGGMHSGINDTRLHSSIDAPARQHQRACTVATRLHGTNAPARCGTNEPARWRQACTASTRPHSGINAPARRHQRACMVASAPTRLHGGNAPARHQRACTVWHQRACTVATSLHGINAPAHHKRACAAASTRLHGSINAPAPTAAPTSLHGGNKPARH
jgi:hypothetical protein